MGEHVTFASGVTALGDILEEKGYTQEFLCGSDGSFAGRSDYFSQHGDYRIFDYFTAIEEGYIAPDYYVWWGYEDLKLYEIAKDEVTRLAASDQPFNMTFLTVDTHHVGGYVCSACEDTYDEQLANVLSCADRQLADFVAWCKKQDFYDDTVIVITGDHPRMDTALVDGVDSMDRTVYNCIINSAAEVETSEKNREFYSEDIFPTTLAAMGFQIQGDRLGLGTNLFSDQPTLGEQLGLDYVGEECAKYSKYYMRKFS